jgi:hypothetical protein
MSTQSTVLLCAGAAASLTGVWSLAGLSERSSLRATPRVLAALGIGLLGVAAVYQRTPAGLRAELSLPAMFGVVSVVALAAGAAKLDAALRDRDGPRAVRRAAGVIAGAFLSMGAVAAASLELLVSSIAHARVGWAHMLPTVGAALVVFVQRGRLAGAGALALGRRGLLVGAFGLVLLGLGRLMVSARPAIATAVPARQPLAAVASEAAPPEKPAVEVPIAAAVVSAAPSAGALASSTAGASGSSGLGAVGAPGELQIESVVSFGMLEADARGGVESRKDKLQACMGDPKHQQSGSLTLKVGIDAGGSVEYVRATGGDLVGTPLAACLLPMLYKMGFAAPAAADAYFEITLRSPPR